MKFRDYSNYEIYEDGRIWSYKRKKFLKPQTDKGGYKRVCLTDNLGKRKMYMVHRVIYESVTREQIPEGLQVNHIDENKTNNNINNLNLMTCKENNNYGSRTQRCSKAVGAFKDGNLVMTFPSTREANRNGFKHSHISECCNGKIKTYKGYIWKFL